MEYTVVQKDDQIFIRLYCSLQEQKLEISIDELEMALRLLRSASGIVTSCQESVISIPQDAQKHSEHYERSITPVVLTRPLPTPTPGIKKNNQVNMKSIEKFLGSIQKEQILYLQESDKDPDNHDGSISENVIGRVIKKLHPAIDKETMFLALNRSAIGMERDLFEIVFSRSLKNEAALIDEDD
jgi:hypothetical protein